MTPISQQAANNAISCLVELRNGAADAPLFLFAGGGGNPCALTPLASLIDNPRALIGVDFCRQDEHSQLPSTVQTMADRSYSAIRALQPCGPYYVVGYSFGGLVAVEVARLLRESGEEIALLGLIDTLFDQRFWPMRIFLRSQLHLIRRHLALLLQLPRSQMIPALFSRSKRLFFRLAQRHAPSSSRIGTPKQPTAASAEQHCKAIMRNYRPKYYAGKITSFEARNHDEYGCDPIELWEVLATEVERLPISGTHVGIISDINSLAELAAALDSRLIEKI